MSPRNRIAAYLAIGTVALYLVLPPRDIPADEESPSQGVALVELFTSEGCSSCPPADALLRDIVHEAEADARPVYALSFHVDYWDRLGWKDPFGSADYTARQRAYAKAFQGNALYTPQMIVNGNVEFVGSDRAKAKRAIADALAAPAALTLNVIAEMNGAGDVRVSIAAEGAPHDAVVVAALVEDGLESNVTRGENANHTLRHSHVVRAVASRPLREIDETEITLAVPKGAVLENCRVIAYAQRPNDFTVLGAVDAPVTM